MTVAVAHHVTAVVAMMAHPVATVMTMAHAMTAVAVTVVHADVDDARRGIDGADHPGGGGSGSGDADGAERGQRGDRKKGLPHGGFLVPCWWPVPG